MMMMKNNMNMNKRKSHEKGELKLVNFKWGYENSYSY